MALARALSIDLDYWARLEDDETTDIIDRIFLNTLSAFDRPVWDGFVQRPGLHRPLRLRPGVDFIPMDPEQPEEHAWGESQPFPPIDEVRGVQARLASMGFPVGPVDNEWGDRSWRALCRYQLESGMVPPSGELDAWALDNPGMLEVLLLALLERDDLKGPVALALLCKSDLFDELRDSDLDAVIDRFFLEAYRRFEPPVRDWMLERPGVHRALRLRPAVDFVPLGEVGPEDRWPEDEPLPPIDTVKGVQARLNEFGYPAGPIDGDFGERTRRAVLRLQLEHGHPNPNGTVDDATRRKLGQADR